MIDPNQALKELDVNTNDLKNQIDAIDPKLLHIKPAPHKWSIFETAEHIAVVDRAIAWVFKQETEPSDRDPSEIVHSIEHYFLDFEKQFPAAPAIQPQGAFQSVEGMFEHLEASRLQFKKTTDWNSLCKEFRHPLFGNLTKLEWVYFAIVHTKRHQQQITDILNIVSSPSA